jgi:hypothetical protein
MIDLYIFINRVIDLVMGPLEPLHPVVPLTAGAVVVGVVAMLIYKYASSQDRIKDAKDKIKGHFYEVWIYIDDAPVIIGSQLRILYNAGRYLVFALPPLIIMIVVFFPLFANFETRYAMRPARPGEEVLVKVRLTRYMDGWKEAVKVELPPGVKMVGHPLRQVRKIKESPDSLKVKRFDYVFNYKLKPEKTGDHELRFKVKDTGFTVPFFCGDKDSYGHRAPPYVTSNLGAALLYPPLEALPDEVLVDRVEIRYPEADFPFPGWETWWVWPFLIISVVAALLVKRVFKVEI